MEPISTQTVQDVQEEFKDVKKPQLREKAEELNQKQPELLAFLQASANELDQEAADLTVYLTFMTAHMYEEAYGEDLAQVTPEDIIQSYRENEELLQSMGESDAPGPPVSGEKPTQPNVLRYVARVLSESAQRKGEDLSNEQKARILLTLKTVLDALDKKVQG